MLHKDFDFKNPDYIKAFRQRMDFIKEIRANPSSIPILKLHYKHNPADFINDFGVTYDPRNAERGLPTIIPFILFPRQREWIEWVVDRWRKQLPGLCEKSRDCGVTWEAIALACTMCLFNDGLAIGFGSRKADYVDKPGTFKPILPKGRMFMENLPREFRGEWAAWRDAPHMRISFPETGSLITGEGGDDIGRGDRASIFFVDEAAHLERPELVEASLSQTTNCRIDMSSVRGMANPFAQKRWGGKVDVFIFDWREDPRKDEEWYRKQCEILDPVVVAQEIDRDYSASVKGVVIPGKWVRAAVDALAKLKVFPTGELGLAFDVADEGDDKDAVCLAKGVEVLETDEWSGKGSDVFESTEYVFELCDDHGLREFRYDADGLGAGVRGDARVINERRKAAKARQVSAVGYRGSEGVFEPEGVVEGTVGGEGDRGRTNQDYFQNHKAQSWWAVRRRFQKTFRWLQWVETGGKEGAPCDPDEIISLNPRNPNLTKLIAELSQVTYRQNEVGKLVIEKRPNGVKSPNMADTVVIRYAPMSREMVPITGGMLAQVAQLGRRR